MNIDKSKINKILCIKLRGIGDVILSTVVFDNLWNEFPQAKIDYLTEPPGKAALEKLSFLNEIILYKKNESFGGLKTIAKVFFNNYDLVLDFYSNPRTAMITFFSHAKYRAGFPYRGRTYAYNLYGPNERDKFHAAQLHLEYLKKIGIEVNSSNLHFGLDEKDISFAEDFYKNNFSENDFVVVLSPSGGWESKKCDAGKFVEIAEAVHQKYHSKFLILWGPDDYEDAAAIKKELKDAAILAPDTTIREGAALMKLAKMVIANDSGPMHISTAVGTPTLSIHGPTNPNLQGPFGEKHASIRLEELDCIGCNLLKCPRKHECFLDLPIIKVMDKVDQLILKNKIIF
ncbi:MAG: glycosyltransferase family 9 protein [Ignavibacteria bacterium]|nr:glycosyltransferase family 9 protein [Ignavibacteria bacterium]